MRLSDFDYDLPEERIAQTPLAQRDASRLLVDTGQQPEHRRVSDLADLLHPGDLVVINDTRVIPARLRLRRRSGGQVEILLLEPLDGTHTVWEALARPARKLKAGETLVADDGAEIIEIGARTAAGDTLEVTVVGSLDAITDHGEMPLPPYITTRLDDPERYQTIYARHPASAAAPTAGLHLTDGVFERLREREIGIARVELVVGLDTFRPVTEDNPLDHRMHTERYRVPADVMERCHQTHRDGGRVVAIGTTTVRALESAASRGELEGRTDIFIHAGYEWKIVDAMMTNFHLPRTTLLMMIDAFVGPRWRDLYAAALDDDYRFLSFGDAMLLDRSA